MTDLFIGKQPIMEPNSPTPIFGSLSLTSHDPLKEAERKTCPKCTHKRMYYCYNCCLPLTDTVPHVTLPTFITVLKCLKEPRSKSSAVTLKVLAPETSEIVDCLPHTIPSFDAGSFLLFPSPDSKTLAELTDEELTSMKNAIFLDSTWRQTKCMIQTPNLEVLPKIKLANYKTLFWRHQNKSKECLATIEAIYYFCVEYYGELIKRGIETQKYSGEYDDILWYYTFNYQRIQDEYQNRRHKGKRFRHMPDYIHN